ncbi:MAG: metallophosphoesterase [Bifidobacteriaceae bacterium]|jgi:hypothetical protein|nr:metallophosphoesterase [Bifidobacteriaceae bacterium]
MSTTVRAPSPAKEDGGDLLRLGVLTDLHLAAAGSPPAMWNNPIHLGKAFDLLDLALDWLDSRVHAALVLGDLADRPDPEIYAQAARRLAALARPVYVVAGNHDMAWPGPAEPSVMAEALTAAGGPLRMFGATRLGRHTLAAGELRADGAGGHVDAGTFRTWPYRTASGTESGAGGLLIWASHFPVLSVRRRVEGCGWLYAGDLANLSAVEAALRRWPGPVLALTGHLHVRTHAISGNILQLNQAALAESPHDVALVELDASGGSLRATRYCHSVARFEPCLETTIDPAVTAFTWNGRRWRASTRGRRQGAAPPARTPAQPPTRTAQGVPTLTTTQ